MRAVQISGYGGSDVVEINDAAPKPGVSTGKLLIEAHAASVNSIDWKLRAGYLQKMVQLPFPITLGGDYSGKVVEVG